MPTNTKLVKAIQLQNQGKLDDATRLFKEVLAADSNNAAALYSLSVIALNAGNLKEAFQKTERGIQASPQFAPLRFVHGAVLQAMGNKDDALRSYDAALEIQPDYVEVLLNSGAMLRSMFRHKEALERFNKILTINPDHTGALSNCGIILTEFKQSAHAIAMFERLIRIKPDFDYALGLLFYERMHICNWEDFEALTSQIIEGVRAGKRVCKSLAFMSASDAASDHLLAARIFAQHYCPKNPKSLWQGERYRHKKIRLAYVSPDLREHPVGHLMAGIFEHHDKSHFETVAISLGLDDQSRLRARMLKAFDQFIDAREMSSEQIAQTMRDMEIDIAVDLGGYTSDTRTDIFAFRPAPVQVNYLGYPGTMGTEYMDYILADRHIIPEGHQQFYAEKVVYLPDTYMPTDSSVCISERTPTRAECGLPETGTVFCSFSHDYKISPPMFDVWMRLLRKIPGSTLWLMSRAELAQANLRKEAELRGVAASRLVFAGRVPRVEDHLARYRLADLFLDTHPYNAHTTAADALMAGLPVLTYMGNAFPARVAGSLLHAIGAPELIAHSLEEYESLALKLVNSPNELKTVKQRIKDNKTSCSLFDTADFCRNLEAAYIAMWRQSQLGGQTDELDKTKQIPKIS
ncbi:MAG: tetratricopeptide repeat protein [Gallionellaceae bacterium]|nr:tetratricopeptide repeat protein [Gallionellaceae bacterium]